MPDPRTLRTHCRAGHEYTPENTYRTPAGHRRCLTCHAIVRRRWYENVGRDRDKDARSRSRRVRHTTYQPPDQQQPTCPESFGWWLAGFTDGEGSFIASTKSNVLRVAFTIQLRADDRDVLEAIHRELKVGVVYFKPRSSKTKLRANPCCVWSVRSITDLYRVVLPFFDRYTLKAKKATDYAIWKQIVTIAASLAPDNREGVLSRAEDTLRPLVTSLKQARQYSGPQ